MKKVNYKMTIVLFCVVLILNLIIVPKKVDAKYIQTVKNGIENFPDSYQSQLNALKELYPNWTFTAYYTGINWNDFIAAETSLHLRNTVVKTSSDLWKDSCGQIASGYSCASKPIICYFADPRNFINEAGIFQFLEMTYNPESQTEAGVQGIIAPSFMNTSVTFMLNDVETTMTYAQIIMEAARQSNMSPYSIAIKILQEVGYPGSSSVSGTYKCDGVDYTGYYNFFNYGAYDKGNAIANGLEYAKANGWNNQYIAIIEGSKLMANAYTNAGQNTAYFYKWDVVGNDTSDLFWHQYMTNIQDPSSQAKNLFNTYAVNSLLGSSLNFIIPVYDNMPNANNLPTSIDTTLETSYYLTGSDVRVRNIPSTSGNILATLEKNTVVTVLEWNAGNANGYEWARIKLANGTEGYLANNYLAKCNLPQNNEGNNNPQEDSTIIKIDENMCIGLPNVSISDAMTALNLENYIVTKQDGTQLQGNEKLATGYKVSANGIDYAVVVLGDTNGDGNTDSLDALKILKYDVGNTNLDDAFLKAADVNKNGSVDSLDALKILKYDVNILNLTL